MSLTRVTIPRHVFFLIFNISYLFYHKFLGVFFYFFYTLKALRLFKEKIKKTNQNDVTWCLDFTSGALYIKQKFLVECGLVKKINEDLYVDLTSRLKIT